VIRQGRTAGLADLPPQRRVYLLRFFGTTFGTEPEDVDQMVRDAVQRPCPVPVPTPGSTHPALAPSFGSTTPIAPIRTRLIATYGPLCGACRSCFGEFIDHDHNSNWYAAVLPVQHLRGQVPAREQLHIRELPDHP
jgi:hypothetical protein